MLVVLLLNNLLSEAGEPPTWVEAARNGGLAVDEDGVVGTIFLDDSTAVPAGAYYLGGIAHATSGRRYVCLWPADDAVSYIGKVAYRQDGAMIVVGTGTTADTSDGWAKTSRGEVLASTSAPEIVHNGIGLRQTGYVCMEEIS